MNYPGASKTTFNKVITYGNRGMDLETLINETNNYYVEKDIAIIYKKPTPIGIAKVSYENKERKIVKSYFKEQSTLDYNGLYKGYYVDFDAKVTKNKTNFPLHNIHQHQLEHMKRIINHGGITFLIISMNGLYFLLNGVDLINYIDNNKSCSIPYEYIKDKGYIIKEGYQPALDYINIVDILIKENVYEKDGK